MIVLVEESSKLVEGVSFFSSLDRSCDLDRDIFASIDKEQGTFKISFL